MLWGWPGMDGACDASSLADLAGLESRRTTTMKDAGRRLVQWAERSRSENMGAGLALETVAWARAMPLLAALTDSSSWWMAFDRLVELASAPAAEQAATETPLVRQLLQAELALVLAYLFPEIQPCRRLLSAGRRALSASLLSLVDERGIIGSRHFDELWPLLASWTRSGALGRHWTEARWTQPAQLRYEAVVRQALRLARADGGQALSSGDRALAAAEFLEAAIRLGGDDDDREIAGRALATLRSWRRGGDSELSLPEATGHYEQASISVLRCGWSWKLPRLTLVYPGSAMRLELARGGDVLLSGQWDVNVRRDGQQLFPTSAWQETCWQSDDDIDYLELELSFGGGWKLERQIAWAKEDEFLYIADGVVGSQPARIEYEARLPLARRAELRLADDSTEGVIWNGSQAALVLPLALPEWRLQAAAGAMRGADGRLAWSQSGTGAALLAPLWFDLAPRRSRRPFTWRRLTVAENLAIVPADVAVGYRVQVAARQWLVYRSLAKAANRTLLGHNLSTSMLIARFDREGEVDSLIEVE